MQRRLQLTHVVRQLRAAARLRPLLADVETKLSSIGRKGGMPVPDRLARGLLLILEAAGVVGAVWLLLPARRAS